MIFVSGALAKAKTLFHRTKSLPFYNLVFTVPYAISYLLTSLLLDDISWLDIAGTRNKPGLREETTDNSTSSARRYPGSLKQIELARETARVLGRLCDC